MLPPDNFRCHDEVTSLKLLMVHVYTDGRIMHNPGGVGGYAAVGLDDEKILFEVYGSDFVTSNNRMELRAAIEACKQEVHRRMTIYSDSQYVVNGASRGLPKWVISGTLQKQT